MSERVFRLILGVSLGLWLLDLESERVLRIIFAGILGFSFIVFREELWFVPWFIAFGLCLAGITGICPVSISLRKLGFR